MSIVIDLAIVAIVVLCTVRHYKLGLACSLLSFGKFVLAFILASVFRVPLAALGLRIFVGEGDASQSQSALAGIIAYVVIFAAVIAISGFIIERLKNIDIPIITKFDKLLGLALGLVIGLFAVSFLSTAIYTVLEFIATLTQNETLMNVYNDSFVFKFIKDISLFEFVRSKF